MQNKGRKLFHSSIRICAEKTVYIDPWQISEEYHDADLILVTHDHPDHYSPEDIAKLMKEGTIVAAPAFMKGAAPEATEFVCPAESYSFAGISVETVAAYNIGRPFHQKELGHVGYIVTLDNTRYYIAGDTDLIPENQLVKCDIAFLPCGGKYTMDAAEAAELANIIKPIITVPTHYGPVTDSSDAAEKFRAMVKPEITVEIHE